MNAQANNSVFYKRLVWKNLKKKACMISLSILTRKSCNHKSTSKTKLTPFVATNNKKLMKMFRKIKRESTQLKIGIIKMSC